jgi:triphosphoribosyl-dephospho-CoA synthetase
VRRGGGASRHEHLKYGRANLIFETSDAKDYDAVASLVEKWLRPFDTQAEAAQFGNTASGVYVREVKLGMSFAEVEAALGPPQTRVELGEKVLYKYKDMTVEFHDGKVSDVK